MLASDPEPEQRPRALALALSGLGFAVCVTSFYTLAGAYGGFVLPQRGVTALPPLELAFYAWYALFGGLAGWLALRLFTQLRLERQLQAAFVNASADPQRCVFALCLLAFGASLAFRRLALEAQPVADDETTYLFIARTLLTGRLSNSPPADPDFFRNQFVVLNEHGWYGKYPIGHPLWLAIGEALHVRDLMAPLAGALSVALCYAVGRRFVSERRALLGAALLCVSPHFIWTCGTLLSQPTGCLALMLGLWLMLLSQERDSLRLAALSGVTFGFGVLVRPLPGALFAGVAALAHLAYAWQAPATVRMRRWIACLLFWGSCALGLGAVLWVNYAQTGDVLSSGYSEVHGHVSPFSNAGDLTNAAYAQRLANSLFGGLLRENYWLFGVPCSLVPLFFARVRRHWLFLAVLGAELAYRLLSPKTVVGTTGPVYLTEVVPLLTLAAADGLVRIGASLSLRARSGSATLTAAGALVALALFWPVGIRTVQQGAFLRSLVYRALIANKAERALVFADALVYPESGTWWAYYPDNPSPALDDDILFVRIPQQDSARGVHEFWQRRFPDRRAFLFMWSPKGEPLFRELRPDE